MGTFSVREGLVPGWLKEDIALVERDVMLREFLVFVTAKDLKKDEALERLLSEERKETETPAEVPLPFIPDNIVYFPLLQQQQAQPS